MTANEVIDVLTSECCPFLNYMTQHIRRLSALYERNRM